MTKNLNNYYMIVCEDNNSFDLKSFPPIHFYHSELNKTFILDYNDLFYYDNNKYYFLIIYSSFSGSYWKLGKPFLKKYQITLDLDSKLIYFYDSFKQNNKENNDKLKDGDLYSIKLKEIILIALCCFLFIILFVLLVKGIKKNRKKRANELKDDDYDYTGIDNANITDNETNKIINNESNSTSIN